MLGVACWWRRQLRRSISLSSRLAFGQPNVCIVRLSSSKAGSGAKGGSKSEGDYLLVSSKNGVTTLTMNRPDKLNGWTRPMMEAIQSEFLRLAKDDTTKVAILTGKGPYYCAGVNLSDTLKPMHPKKLFNTIVKHNQGLFDSFINFPKVRSAVFGACDPSCRFVDAWRGQLSC